jgi:glycosyltransferase involved in cell wall biosynthesis
MDGSDSASQPGLCSGATVSRPDSERVLWVTEEPPDRTLGGGNIRQAHLFQALAEAVPTDLLTVGPLTDRHVRDAATSVEVLPRRTAFWSDNLVLRRALELTIILASPYPSAMYPAGPNRRSLAAALRAIAGRYGVVYVEHGALGPLYRVLPGVPKVLTFQHLVSEMIVQELTEPAGRRQTWFRTRDLAKARRLEREALGRYERVITCSEDDAATLRALDPDAPASISVVPNGVDLSAFAVTPVPEAPRVLFPGTLNFAPNVDGARWFVHNVWPTVQDAFPAAELRIAGRAPTAEVHELGRVEGITVLADVASMVEQFEWSRAVVVPLRIGTGTRLKALEAMAAARPVVGSSIGLAGIGAVDGLNARVADDPDAFARATIQILDDDRVAAGLAHAGRAHVEAQYGWDQIGSQLVELVGELMETRRSDA